MKNSLPAIVKSKQDILDAGFYKKLESLIKAKDQLVSDTTELTKRMILFASSLNDLKAEANRLDAASKRKVHIEEFEKHLTIRALFLSVMRAWMPVMRAVIRRRIRNMAPHRVHPPTEPREPRSRLPSGRQSEAPPTIPP